MTNLEIEILKYAKDKGYKWIARDENDSLWMFDNEPSKGHNMWDEHISINNLEMVFNDLFLFIKWKDDEPKSIDELLDSVVAESSTSGRNIIVGTKILEMKDEIKDLKNRNQSLEKEYKDFIEDYNLLENNYKKAIGKIMNLEDEIKELKQSNIQIQNDELPDEMEVLKKENQRLNKIIDRLIGE